MSGWNAVSLTISTKVRSWRANECLVKREGHEKFKEKLKRQRMRGQSGIGENFRVWRSEEDMILRQQYQCNVSLNKHGNLP